MKICSISLFKKHILEQMRYQFSSNRLVTFFPQKNNNIKGWWGHGTTRTLENNLALSSKFEDAHIEPLAISPWNICPKETLVHENQESYTSMFTNSTVYNTKNLTHHTNDSVVE